MKKGSKTGGEALKYIIVFGVLFALGILAVWGITGRFPGAPVARAFVEQGDTVRINYTGWHDNGTLFDSGILEFEVGAGEILTKGIDEGVLGMKLNESRFLNLTPEYAFGEYDPSLVIEQPRTVMKNSTITFSATPEEFNATFGGMPEEGMIVSSVDLPWKRVEILGFTNTTMTWKLMPPEGHKTSWPLDCEDRNRAVPTEMDCYGVATMNLTEDGETIEIKIDPFIGEMVTVGGVWARVLEGDESTYYMDFNHELAGEGFIYHVELLGLEKGP